MQLITEMGLPDFQIRGIIKGYRILAKIDTLTCGESTGPLFTLVAFIEDMLPAFRRTMVDGVFTKEHEELQELVLSDKSDDEVMAVLLDPDPPTMQDLPTIPDNS